MLVYYTCVLRLVHVASASVEFLIQKNIALIPAARSKSLVSVEEHCAEQEHQTLVLLLPTKVHRLFEVIHPVDFVAGSSLFTYCMSLLGFH